MPHNSSMTGALVGVVVDANGCALPNLTITAHVRSADTTVDATSDASGAFAFSDLPPGEYVLTMADNVVVWSGNVIVAKTSRSDAIRPRPDSATRFQGWRLPGL